MALGEVRQMVFLLHVGAIIGGFGGRKAEEVMEFSTIDSIPPEADYDGVALYSGGTDSTLAPLLAKNEVGENILLLMINLGDHDAVLDKARARASIIGWDFLLIEATREFADAVLREAIQLRADYWGYPLGTPLGRAYQVSVAVDVLRRLNEHVQRPRVVIHGCARKQNTRYRIERALSDEVGIAVVGPLAERSYSRAEKVELLADFGVKVLSQDDVATDNNIFCRALEGDLLNTLDDPAKLDVYEVVESPQSAPDEEEILTLSFEAGSPTACNGVESRLDDIVRTCRDRGAAHGVGRVTVFEDTIPELGYKERGVYESPAATILALAHSYLEGACLTKQERIAFRAIRHRWAEVVYRGEWHTSDRRELASLASRLNENLTGDVQVRLYKGRASVAAAVIPGTLLIAPKSLAGAY